MMQTDHLTGAADSTYVLVDTPAAFSAMLEVLLDQPIVAVDTESNNLYAYREQVSLIQFSTPDQDYIVDPLADLPLLELGSLFANPDISKVFHAAEYDLICLRRDFGFTVRHIFDTMHASRILGKPRVGLAALLAQYFGVHLDKRWQRADWGLRPLPPEQLDYARLDTHFLISLRDHLRQELVARNLLALAEEDFERLTEVRETHNGFNPDGFWRLPGVRDLSPRSLAVLRALYLWREREAERMDRPPFKVLHNRDLVRLADALPRNRHDLRNISGLAFLARTAHGEQVLQVISDALQSPPPLTPPSPARPKPEYTARYDALRRWRRDVSQALGVESDIVLSRAAMIAIANANPRSLEDLQALDVLGPVRLGMYGARILDVLRRVE